MRESLYKQLQHLVDTTCGDDVKDAFEEACRENAADQDQGDDVRALWLQLADALAEIPNFGV